MNRKLVQIARKYHQQCAKSYHRICTGVSKYGEIVPTNKKEADRIKYERKFELDWVKCVQDLKPNGFKRSEINRAIKEYRGSNG